MQKPLSLPAGIPLSARYLSLPHLCLLCAAGEAVPDNQYRSWLPLKADLPISLPNLFIHFRPREPSREARGRKAGSALLQLLLSSGSFTRLGLAPAAARPRAHQVKPWKCTKLPVCCLSFLLMPCASVLTVNSHLKQPCATELSAGNVSEPHRPFKILPWMKGHQSARRDPCLWVTSLREMHSITFLVFFFWSGFFYSSVTMQKSLKVKKIRQMEQRTLTVFLGEGSALSPPPSPKCWWPAPSLLMGFEAAGPFSRVIILLNGDIFNPLNIVYPCSQPSAQVHTTPKQETCKSHLVWESSPETKKKVSNQGSVHVLEDTSTTSTMNQTGHINN